MLRFLWRATRGHRFTPWRSPYWRWRIETYWGIHAEAIGFREFVRFCFEHRGELCRFLRWTGRMDRWQRSRHG
jgi:hypothetical protein